MTGHPHITFRTFRLNGEARMLSVAPDIRLIDLLRDHLGHMAAKKGCGIGRCGACTVLMNGTAVNSCLLMAWQLDGADIVTPEGLDVFAEAAIVRAALAAENAFQCGYCAPGFTVVLTAFLKENRAAQEADILAALEGNLCRCTGYHSIIRGALAAATALSEDTQSAAGDGP